jgi:hypothetical protein
LNEAITWVADPRHTSVRNDGETSAGLSLLDNLWGAIGLIVLVHAHEGLFDAVMSEKKSRVPSVLTSNDIHRLKDAEGATRDVFPVADGKRDKVDGVSDLRHEQR